MISLDTLGDEHVHVSLQGEEAIALAITSPEFGRIGHVRLDRDQAIQLVGALTGLVLDHGGGPQPSVDAAT